MKYKQTHFDNQMISNETKQTLITVTVPVYNEWDFIKETIDSISSQDYKTLEILIADNDSSDNTGILCRELALKDKRIKYHRHDKNIGLTLNYEYLAKWAQGKYIMFAEGHNKWPPNLLSQCASHLENNESITIAFGTPVWIDREGNPIRKFSGWYGYDTRGLNTVSRFLWYSGEA